MALSELDNKSLAERKIRFEHRLTKAEKRKPEILTRYADETQRAAIEKELEKQIEDIRAGLNKINEEISRRNV